MVNDERVGLTGKDGMAGMHRRAFAYAMPVVCLLLLLVLFAGLALLDPHAAVAQEQSPDIVEGSGREIGPTDWLYHLPLALGAAMVVIVVDAIVILKIILGRRRRQ